MSSKKSAVLHKLREARGQGAARVARAQDELDGMAKWGVSDSNGIRIVVWTLGAVPSGFKNVTRVTDRGN